MKIIHEWENPENLIWTNPENGLEWYLDKNTTNYCKRPYLDNRPLLKATCFFVVKTENGKKIPLTRILIDNETNDILADEQNLEAMGAKIDILRLTL